MHVADWVNLASDYSHTCTSSLVERFTWRCDNHSGELEINTIGDLIVDFKPGADIKHEGSRVVYGDVPRVVYLSLRDVAVDENSHVFDTLFVDEIDGHESWSVDATQ